MILVYFQKGLLLEVDHLCEFHQLQFIVLTLLTDLTVFPRNLDDDEEEEYPLRIMTVWSKWDTFELQSDWLNLNCTHSSQKNSSSKHK